MKNFWNPTRIVTVLFLTALFSLHVSSQNKTIIKNLHPINYSNIDPQVLEPGKFRVKFKFAAEEHLSTPKKLKSQSGIAVTGITEIDALNRLFGVSKGKALLSDLYNSSLKSANIQSEKHKKYGLHLWYEFQAKPDANLSELIERYKKNKYVETVEPVFKIVPVLPVKSPQNQGINNQSHQLSWLPDDEMFSSQWHYNNTGQNDGLEDADIDLPEAWEITQGNPEVIVAVIDQGVDFNHPDLAGNMWSEIGPEGTSTYPGEHGTHVAGTIAAMNNNGTGVSGIAGGSGNNDGVRIMSLDLFNGQHGMSTLEMNVWAADNGAAISQNSWGYMGPDYYNQSDLEGIIYFNENGGGDVMDGGITFFAAGNDSDNGNWYPGCFEQAIAVAATNNNDQVSYYSNYGDWVDIAAPGGETTRTYEGGVLSTITNESYDYFQGTSMACPHVSGVAALVLSMAPGWFTNEQLAEILLSSTDDIYTNNPGYEGLLGTGRLNAYQALEKAQEYMGNVKNPTSFVAHATSESEIQIEWNLNENANQVMLAMSSESEFGDPVDGTTYTAGSALTGGGTILYNGTDLTINIDDLERNTTYHFRIWSFDENLEYSYGRSTQTKTFAPDISITPTELNFEKSYIGYPKRRILEITNHGESSLLISSIQFSSTDFSSASNPESIKSGTTFKWEIEYNPAQTGSYSETLSFETNVPGNERITVPITGETSDQIPALEYTPDAIEETLNSGESSLQTLELINTGDGDLTYNIVALSIQPDNSSAIPPINGSTVPASKNRVNIIPDQAKEIKENGGSENAGFYWETTPYNWYDIKEGTELSLGDDDSQSNIPLEFSFKYYENTFNSVIVKSNGWISFNNQSGWYPGCIPGEGGAICPFGIDLYPDAEGAIRYKTIGVEPTRKFVVEYNNIRLYGQSLRNTFQIVLSEGSNTIQFQYKSIESVPYSIGIEDIDGSRGIGNCASGENFLNPQIVSDQQSIHFMPASICSISPSTGILAPGQSTSITIELNATGLVEDTYHPDITIFNNDPRQEEVSIPVTLHVIGTPNLQIPTDTVLFEPAFLEATTTASLMVDNSTGTKALTISGVSTSGAPFYIDNWPPTVAPGESEIIEINFSPDQQDHFKGSLTISSDDPTNPEKTIILLGQGIIPPVIEATPQLFDVTLHAGDSINKQLTITNSATNSIPLKVNLKIVSLNDQEENESPNLIIGEPGIMQSIVPTPLIRTTQTFENTIEPQTTTGANILFLTSLETMGFKFHQDLQLLPNVSNVDSVAISYRTPNTAYLLQYDMVILSTSYNMDDPTGLGNNLADYIDQGGKLCVLNGALSTGGGWTIAGRITEEDYLPLALNTYSSINTSCNTFTNHPLTENLLSLSTELYSHSGLQGNGISLGTYDSGYSCLAYNPNNPIVAINVYPAEGYYTESLMILMENTVDWLTKTTPWLYPDQNNLEIAPENTQDITLTFNAEGMDAGKYEATISLLSNDPERPEISLPASLTIADAAGIAPQRTSINFGDIPIGRTRTVPLDIQNTGSAPLNISAINSSQQEFSCNTDLPLSIAPGETATINTEFTPIDSTDYTGQLTIISNDPTDPEVKIDMHGSSFHAAQIQVTPHSMEEEIFEGEMVEKILTITNSGQGESLIYDILVSYITPFNNFNGPDEGGYIWETSTIEPMDFTNATELPLSDDDYQTNIPLGFDFNYYGQTFSSVNIMSNGWISFTEYETWFPSCIPGYRGAIAPFAKDLNRYGDDSICYKTLGNAPNRLFIIDYNISNFGSPSAKEHFQIILEESTNKIKFQYLEINGSPACVGINDPDGLTGLGSCAADNCLLPLETITSGNAIVFRKVYQDWMSISEYAGEILSGQQQELQVRMPENDLPPGEYWANIQVNSNDPFSPILNIPVNLTINEQQRYSVTFHYQTQFAEALTDVNLNFDEQEMETGTTEILNLLPGTYSYSATKDGYGQGENASGEVIIENDDIVVDATLIAFLYRVNLQAYPAGSGSFNGAQSYYTGQQVYLEALPTNGFQFYNWTDQNNNILSEQTGFSFNMPPSDLNYTGNFGVFSADASPQAEFIKIYPNPAKELLQVSIKNPTELQLVEIIGPSGQTLQQLQPAENKTISLPISDLVPGTYLLKVTCKQEVKYFKFIKE